MKKSIKQTTHHTSKWQIAFSIVLSVNILFLVLLSYLIYPVSNGDSSMVAWAGLGILLILFYYGVPLAVINTIFFYFYLKKYKPSKFGEIVGTVLFGFSLMVVLFALLSFSLFLH